MGKLLGILTGILAVIGMPLFAVLGAISFLSWMSSDDPQHQKLSFVAANVIDDKFSDSPILVTIPLFVLVGYLMAESNTPQRIVRAATTTLGWLPGGVAIVCIIASAVFTVLTGGSGVTIVAIGGLLYPVLVQEGYDKKFALGLVTTAGAVGLLLPPSPLVLIYCYVTGVNVTKAYYATLFPGLVLMGMLVAYAVVMSILQKVPRRAFRPAAALQALWEVKWELFAPVLVLAGLGAGLMELHESAAAAALYTLIIEVYVYKDLTWKKVMHVAKDAMSLAGAIIIIMAMATALTNYIVHAGIPASVLAWFAERGMTEKWQFIIVLNIFLIIMGMLMDAFSVLLVSLPLLIPLAASFGLHPFYLAAMFLLNLEIGYVTPPVGLNLFIASFRFRRPVVEVYRVVVPYVGLLLAGLAIIVLFEPLSTFTVKDEIAEIRAQAKEETAKTGIQVRPTGAWELECIQEDRNNIIACTEAERKYWEEVIEGTVPAVEGGTGEPATGDPTIDDFDDVPKPKEVTVDDFDDPAPSVSAPAPSAAPTAEPAPSADPSPDGF